VGSIAIASPPHAENSSVLNALRHLRFGQHSTGAENHQEIPSAQRLAASKVWAALLSIPFSLTFSAQRLAASKVWAYLAKEQSPGADCAQRLAASKVWASKDWRLFLILCSTPCGI